MNNSQKKHIASVKCGIDIAGIIFIFYLDSPLLCVLLSLQQGA